MDIEGGSGVSDRSRGGTATSDITSLICLGPPNSSEAVCPIQRYTTNRHNDGGPELRHKKYSGYWGVPGLVTLRVAGSNSPDTKMLSFLKCGCETIWRRM